MNRKRETRRAMAGTILLTLASMVGGPGAEARGQDHRQAPTQRGHQWVRSHLFTLMGLVRMTPKPFDVEQYRGAGFNALLAWEPGTYDVLLPQAAEADLPFFVNLEKWGAEKAGRADSTEESLAEALKELDTDASRTVIAKITAHPGCLGFLVNDEISRPMHLRYTRHMLQWLREQHPDMLALSNAHPAGHEGVPGYGHLDRYFDEFAAMLEPDIFMTDVYPLGDPDGTSHDYFKLLAAVRKTALNHGMPYWMFIQSFETHGSWSRRLPSESDLRFQMFVPLTYGYTGILYFTYDIAFQRGLIEASGEPNALYHAAAQAKQEVANIGAVMRFLTSVDARYVPGRHKEGHAIVANPLPSGTKAWEAGAGDDMHILKVTVAPGDDGLSDPALLEHRQNKDGLLGFFRDDAGGRYFMLTNLWHGADATAQERALTFTVQFALHVKTLYRLNRLTGRVEQVPLQDGKLHLTLPGGTGDLFKYNDDTFPGVER